MNSTSRLSKFDQLYRSVWLTKFFTKGWGEPEKLRRCVEFRPNFLTRESCARLISADYPIIIDKEETVGKTRIINGHFLSPLAVHLPEIVKSPVDKAHFQMVLPLSKSPSISNNFNPLVIQLAGTGDQFFGRRRFLMANPLAKEHGVASIILENPFYGLRRPTEQRRSSLCNVMDLFVMGGCLILECLVLLDWSERQGYWPLALHGVSMGGHMASLAAGSYSKPVALVPCLSWSTASCAFTTGVMSKSIPWSLLERQYLSYRGATPFFSGSEIDAHAPTQVQLSQQPTEKILPQPDNKTVAITVPTSAWLANSRLQAFVNGFLWPVFYLKRRQTRLAWGSSDHSARTAVIDQLRHVMDEFTHLANFPKPLDQNLIIAVAAKLDAYLPRDGVTSLDEIWPEAEIRYVDRGHIAAFLLDQKLFRIAIVDALNRMAIKYKKGYD